MSPLGVLWPPSFSLVLHLCLVAANAASACTVRAHHSCQAGHCCEHLNHTHDSQQNGWAGFLPMQRPSWTAAHIDTGQTCKPASGRVEAASDGLGAASGWTEPARLNLYRLTIWGSAASRLPYSAWLEYSSNSGMAFKLRFLGTCRHAACSDIMLPSNFPGHMPSHTQKDRTFQYACQRLANVIQMQMKHSSIMTMVHGQQGTACNKSGG